MNKILLLPLTLALMILGCATRATHDGPQGSVQTSYENPEQLQYGSQAIVDAFAAEVARARGNKLSARPTVAVQNTPMLIFFDESTNNITVPFWETQPAEMREVFRKFSGGGEEDARDLFNAFFNGFLIAHESSHWFQSAAKRHESTLYANENQANRLAVAFWRTQPGGEQFLARLEKLATRAAAQLTDPTPPGEDPVAYFGANYQTLGQDPLKYGYYQFRFMAEALRDRSQLNFSEIVGAK